MKKILSLFVLVLSITFFSSCEKKDCCKKDANEKAKTDNSNFVPTYISEESIFNLESRWITQKKDSISLKDLSNKITVAAMVFTHCESACPRIVADMQRIEKAFTPDELKQIQFVLISMDPERDTPERFTEFSQEHKLNDWICISASEDATMEIANVLNVRVKKLSDGGFDHSNTIHLIDRNGNIVFQQNGLSQEPKEIIEKIKSTF